MTFQARMQQFEKNEESSVLLSDISGSFLSSPGIYTEEEHVTIFDNGSVGNGDAAVVVFPGHNGVGGFTTTKKQSLGGVANTVDEITAPGCDIDIDSKVCAWQAEQSRLLLSELIRQVHHHRRRRNSVPLPIDDGIYSRLLKKVLQHLVGVDDPVVLDALFDSRGYSLGGDLFEMQFWERLLRENAKERGYPLWRTLNPVSENEEYDEVSQSPSSGKDYMDQSQSSTAPFRSMLLDWGIEERHSDNTDSSTDWDEAVGLSMIWEIIRTHFCTKTSPTVTRSHSSIQQRHSQSCTSQSVRSKNTCSRRSCYWEAGLTISSGISVGGGWTEI